jgi:hypothetical protein
VISVLRTVHLDIYRKRSHFCALIVHQSTANTVCVHSVVDIYANVWFSAVVHNNGGSSMHMVSERRIAAPAPTPTSCSIAPSSFVQPIPVPIIEDQPVNIDIASALIDLSANRNCFEIGSIELEGSSFWYLFHSLAYF